jgi:hypothetical protein
MKSEITLKLSDGYSKEEKTSKLLIKISYIETNATNANAEIEIANKLKENGVDIVNVIMTEVIATKRNATIDDAFKISKLLEEIRNEFAGVI